MHRLVALISCLLLAGAACAGSRGTADAPQSTAEGAVDRGAATPPSMAEPTETNEEIVRHDTPEGEAAVELVVEPREVRLGETVTVRLVNRGEVGLLTGFRYNVEHWDGRGWVDAPWPKNLVFKAIGLFLPPGGSTDPQAWPPDGLRVQPGLYRVLKSASYEDPAHVRPDVQLRPQTRFRVRSNGEPAG